MDAGPLAGRTVAGWRLLRLLGQGSVGAVYLAEGPGVSAPVALKLVPLDASGGLAPAQAAFLRSADINRRLHHPGIVVLHDAGVEGGTGWLAMEAVPGTDLGRYTHASRLLPEPAVLQVLQQVALALAHAHGQGVVHRDLKPANVLVHWASRTVKLADFGLARAADAAQTGTGVVPGTPVYMAPEQLAGEVPTPASDFYALGVMLFQLLSARLPHEAATMGALLRAVSSESAPDLRLLRPATPAPLAEFVARLLDKRPSARPADGEALAGQLQALRLGA